MSENGEIYVRSPVKIPFEPECKLYSRDNLDLVIAHEKGLLHSSQLLATHFIMSCSSPISVDGIQDKWDHREWINAGKIYPASDVPLFLQQAQADVLLIPAKYAFSERRCMHSPTGGNRF
jgi:hypothetical protein